MTTRKESKVLQEKSIKSIQYDLFTEFLTNDKEKVSNTVELWESVPKYFFTPVQIERLRTQKGHADPYKWDYIHNKIHYSVVIQPALIKQKDGKFKAFFPGITEELVEEALKKIFSNQQYGAHDPSNIASWVKFSLSMIQRELKTRGRDRNRNQIKQAINIMKSCNITLYREGEEIWNGSILQDLVTVGRDKYLSDTESYHIARLPAFISHSINCLGYRQFNYERLMSCDEQLSRWIYKQLIHRYTQANVVNNYHFMFSSIRESGLLQQTEFRKNKLKINSALLELQEKGVISSFTEEPRKEGRKMIDVKYVVYPSHEFISEQKAANKRHKVSLETAERTGIVSDESSDKVSRLEYQ